MNVRNPHILRTLPIIHFNFFGTSFVLDDVEISSLHLGGGEMISWKIQNKKY